MIRSTGSPARGFQQGSDQLRIFELVHFGHDARGPALLAVLEQERELCRAIRGDRRGRDGSSAIARQPAAVCPRSGGADAYPIVTFSWILLYKNYDNAEKAKTIRDLFRWCLQDGQQFATQLGYVRLPQNVTSKALAALGTITSGE
jgi:hypothetical protein